MSTPEEEALKSAVEGLGLTSIFTGDLYVLAAGADVRDRNQGRLLRETAQHYSELADTLSAAQPDPRSVSASVAALRSSLNLVDSATLANPFMERHQAGIEALRTALEQYAPGAEIDESTIVSRQREIRKGI